MGCAHAPQASPATADTYHQVELRLPHVVRVMAELDESVRATAGDCKQLAALLRHFGLVHRADLDEFSRLYDALGADDRDRFELDHGGERQQIEVVYKDLHAGCERDPEVAAALDVAGIGRTH